MSAVLQRIPEPHGEVTIDLDPYMKYALDDVIETIMLFGQYPQPSTRFPSRPQFLLYEHIENEWDQRRITGLVIAALTDYSNEFFTTRMKADADLREELKDKLRDSDMVRDRARALAEEDE